MGDVAIAVNPKDERFKNLVGKFAIIPVVKRKIKIIEDYYADPEQGTGAVKITPAHDFNDYDVGKRNKLDIINILEKDGKININGIKSYVGLDRFEARKKIIIELKNLNVLEKIENIKNKVPYGDRSNTIIEPLLTEQWFVDAKSLSKKPIQTVKKKKKQISSQKIGLKLITNGCKILNHGVFQDRFGGDTGFQFGTVTTEKYLQLSPKKMQKN